MLYPVAQEVVTAAIAWRNLSLRRMLVVARKEFYHIFRDLRILFLVTVAPAFLLVMLSYVFALDVERVYLGVQNLDHTPLSRAFASHVAADPDFELVTWLDPGEDTDPLFVRGVVDMVLVIPPGFAARVLEGGPAPVQCVVDGVDGLAASRMIGLLESRVAAFTGERVSSRARLAGTPAADGEVFEVSDRAWYNEALKSLVSMVPGLLAVVLSMPALAMALALAREKETGSFEGLIVTPVRGSEYLTGKLVTYVVSGLASTVLAWLVATLWFRVPFRGDLAALLLLTAGYLFASMGISMLVASFARNQQTAMFLVLMVFFIPSFFLSGLIRPVTDEPIGRAVAHILPSTHFIFISRGVFLKGLGLPALQGSALGLVAIGVACLAISLRLFDKKIP